MGWILIKGGTWSANAQNTSRAEPAMANWEQRGTHRPTIFARSSLPVKRSGKERPIQYYSSMKKYIHTFFACGEVDIKKRNNKTNNNKTNKQSISLTQNPMSKQSNREPDTLGISSVSHEISAVIWCKNR